MRESYEVLDGHAGGNPTRLVVGGVPALSGSTVAEQARDFAGRFDHVRTAMVLEPRGGNLTSSAVLVPPNDPAADFGLFFMEAHGYLPMCGSDTIATTTMLIETGRHPATGPRTTIRFETPAGIVTATAATEGDQVESVTFQNAPARVEALDEAFDSPRIGAFTADIAYGGNHYAIVDAAALDLDISGGQNQRAIETALAVLSAVVPRYEQVDHVLFHCADPALGDADRIMVVIPPGIIDRSPCGTGTTARTAALVARGALGADGILTHQSVTGERFTGAVVATDGAETIIAITGRGHLIGEGTIHIDSRDRLGHGFRVD